MLNNVPANNLRSNVQLAITEWQRKFTVWSEHAQNVHGETIPPTRTCIY